MRQKEREGEKDKEKMRGREERLRGRDEKIERGVQRMDLISERDTSLETRRRSCTEASPKQTCFLYENDMLFKKQNKQTSKT